MKVFVARVIVVFTLGIAPALADDGWVLWGSVDSKTISPFWFMVRGTQTFDDCKAEATFKRMELLAELRRENRGNKNVEVEVEAQRDGRLIRKSVKEENGTVLDWHRYHFICLSAATDPRG